MVTDSSPRSLSLSQYVVRGAIAGIVLAVLLHFGYVLLAGNFRTVLPGAVYRCAQPSDEQLERMIREHGIRTVVNLRGCCPTAEWYRKQARVTGRLGVSLEDVGLSATRLPTVIGVRQLLEVIERTAYPILFHCHQGADRTGLASVMTVLLRTDATLAEARKHLGPRSGHLPFGRTARIDRFFDLYEDWLSARQEEHSSERFRSWVCEHYCPGEGRAELSLLEPVRHVEGQRPSLTCQAGVSRVVQVRCRNTSHSPWEFQPGTNAGTHGLWMVLDDQERTIVVGRAGLFHAVVEPGEHIDLPIPLPSLSPGRYELRFDLLSEQHAQFVQLGNPLLVVVLEVS